MRVLFYTAAVTAAFNANLAQAVRIDSLNNFESVYDQYAQTEIAPIIVVPAASAAGPLTQAVIAQGDYGSCAGASAKASIKK